MEPGARLGLSIRRGLNDNDEALVLYLTKLTLAKSHLLGATQ